MKKKGIVFCIPGHGHVNPSLPIVKELIGQGHELDYCCMKDFRGQIERTDAKFIPFPYDISYSSSEDFNLLETFADVVEYSYLAMDQLKTMVQKGRYDYIIVDYYTLWGRLLALQVGLPVMTLNPTFAMHPDLKEPLDTMKSILKMPWKSGKGAVRIWKFYNKIKKRYKVPKGGLNGLLKDVVDGPHICFTAKELQPQKELFPDHYFFTGPSIDLGTRILDTDFPIEKLEGKKVVYISLGSIIVNKTFIATCIQAFTGTDFLVVLNIGKALKKETFQVPENIILCHFAPQLEILSRADVFVTHGGMNSVQEGLYFEVPLVVLPQVSDQFLVAQTVVNHNLGVWLKLKSLTAQELLENTNRMYNNKQIKNNLQAMSKALKSAGGVPKATSIINDWINNLN